MNVEQQPQFRQIPESEKLNTELPEITLTPDVLVIGGGPAGMVVAKELAKANLEVLLVDERKTLGGQYFKQPQMELSQLDGQFQEGRAIINELLASKIKVLSNTKIWGAFDPDHILGYNQENRFVFRAKQVVIATGAFERAFPIPGWTLPGVFTTGAAQTLLRSYQTTIPGRVLISGNGPLNLQIAAELCKANANVVAYVESAKLFKLRNIVLSFLLGLLSPTLGIRGAGYLLTLVRNKVKIIDANIPTKLTGDDSLAKVNLSSLRNGSLQAGAEFEVDSMAMGFGFTSSNEIAKLLGCELVLNNQLLSTKVKTDFVGTTNIANVWAIGDSATINGAQIAKLRGKLLAAKFLKKSLIARALVSIDLLRQLAFQKVLWKIFESPTYLTEFADEQTIICRCLSITKTELEETLQEEIETIGALKRITRAGMGKCQGRYCSPLAQDLLSKNHHQDLNEHSGFAPQVPIKPTPISVIAYPSEHQH